MTLRSLVKSRLFVLGLLCLSCTKQDTLVLTLAGDIMLDRGVSMVVRRQGMHALFAPVTSLFRGSDASVVNLECPLTEKSDPAEKEYVFQAPCSLAVALSQAGITHASLANNHSLDHRQQGLHSTIVALRHNSIVPVGLSAEPEVIRKGSLTLAIFSANLVTEESDPGNDSLIFSPSGSQAIQTIGDYKKANPNTLIILSIHWGFEYREYPTSTQRALGRQLVEAGATVVAGHHPHVLQPVEFYKNGAILYSLGNFIFDQAPPVTRRSMLASISFSADGIREIILYPMVIESCIPKPCSEQDWEEVEIIGKPHKVTWKFLKEAG